MFIIQHNGAATNAINFANQNESIGANSYNTVWYAEADADLDEYILIQAKVVGQNRIGSFGPYSLANLKPETEYVIEYVTAFEENRDAITNFDKALEFRLLGTSIPFTTPAEPQDAVFSDSNFGSTLRVGTEYTLTVSARYSNNINASGYPDSLSPTEFTSGEYHYFRLKGTISSSDLSGLSTRYDVSMTAFAADGAGKSDTASDTLTVKDGLPEISGSLSNDMRVGEFYSEELSKNSYARTISTSGTILSLQDNMSFSTSSMTLEGTPTSSGDYSFAVTGTNNSNETDSYSITFNVLPLLPTWENNTISTNFIVDESYEDSISANNATAYAVTSGSLPSGVSLDSSTGELSGSPDIAGEQVQFTLGAKNSADEYIYTQLYNVTVQENGGNLITYNGSFWEEDEVYVYLNGTWSRARVYLYDGNSWIKSAQL